MRKALRGSQSLRRIPPANMSLQTAIPALLLFACCAARAAADVSELLLAPPPDALTTDFRHAATVQPPPPQPPQGPPAPFLQNDGAPRGISSQQAGDLVPTRRVFFRLGDNPHLSDLQGLTARAATCRDSGTCPEPPLLNPNNFLTGFPNAAPSDLRFLNVVNFPVPPEFSRSLVNAASPLPLTGAFSNRAPAQMDAPPNGSPGAVSDRSSPLQFINNAPPTQMVSRSDTPRPSFANNAPTMQLLSASDAPRLSFSSSIPQRIFRSDNSRKPLPSRAPQTHMGSVSGISALLFPNNAPPARVFFRPNDPQLPLSNGALPTQLFPRAEAPRPSLLNNAPLSQLVSRSGGPRFAPSNSAASSQLLHRPEDFSLPQRNAISNSTVCTPDNPCSFPEFSNEISAGNKIPANYQFSYAVQDAASASDFAHEETAQEEGIKGQYRVLLPDGRQQVVSYRADEGGFRPEISYQ